MQEIALCALSRTDFFKNAAFTGGTCLRILHNLHRFSEDLDFSLLSADASFRWSPLLERLSLEFETYDLKLKTRDRSEASCTIKKDFLKEDSFGIVLQLSYSRNTSDTQKILIKLEIDTNPPAVAKCESRIVRFPLPFSIRAHDLPSLCAGKCLALLCREYDKGRDWFDYLWYVAQNVKTNLRLLTAGLMQNGPWKNKRAIVTNEFLNEALHNKIDTVNWEAAIQEVRPFLTAPFAADVKNWHCDYFHKTVDLFCEA